MTTTKLMTRHPDFGRDPWLGPVDPLGLDSERHEFHLANPDHPRSQELFGSSPVFSGADTLSGDIQHLPDGLQVYMSYKDNYEGFDSPAGTLTLVKRFPTGIIAGLPWGYTSASNMSSLIRTAGSRRYVRWGAHYGFGPHICGPRTCGFPQVDWTQWDDHGADGSNIDRSMGAYLPAGMGNRPLLVPITIFGHVASLCADMEPGAMQIGEFGSWYDNVAMHPVPIHVVITIPEEEDLVASAVDGKGQVHVFVLIPHDKSDRTKGGKVFELYQQRTKRGGYGWTSDKQGVKAEAYYLGDVGG
jgi:hypothetical protein